MAIMNLVAASTSSTIMALSLRSCPIANVAGLCHDVDKAVVCGIFLPM
jgi:hypothetical protein